MFICPTTNLGESITVTAIADETGNTYNIAETTPCPALLQYSRHKFNKLRHKKLAYHMFTCTFPTSSLQCHDLLTL